MVMRDIKLVLLLAIAFNLTSCTRAFGIDPKLENGKVWFHSTGLLFSGPSCATKIEVEDLTDYRLVWSASSPTGACSLKFPIEYGTSFPDQSQKPVQLPQELTDAVVYEITIYSSGAVGREAFSIEDGEIRIWEY